MLPTILYRFHKLLLAEELLVKLNSMCEIEVKLSLNGKFINLQVYKFIYY